MKKKIYFCGSIRGAKAEDNLYKKIIDHMKNNGHTVLTEHIGDIKKNEKERKYDKDIYNQDMSFLNESNIVIAECTYPSIGVGYELRSAEVLNIPTHVFYKKSKAELSAMINGDEYFNIQRYETLDELFEILDEILGDL